MEKIHSPVAVPEMEDLPCGVKEFHLITPSVNISVRLKQATCIGGKFRIPSFFGSIFLMGSNSCLSITGLDTLKLGQERSTIHVLHRSGLPEEKGMTKLAISKKFL